MGEGLVSKWTKLQKVKEGKTDRKLLIGTGMSTKDSAFEAAKEAAENALKELNGKKPTISYAFFSGDYDPYKLSEGLQSILKGTEFVGGLGDRVIFGNQVIEKGIVVASIQSDFLHVGVASKENVSADPYEIAKKTTKEALSKLTVDNYVDPYLQALRMKGGDIRSIVKIPPYYINVFTKGFQLPKMGEETRIILGISDVVGRQIPIWGGSFETALEKVMTKYEIYSLHSGKVLKDGLIIVFNSSSLLYGNSIAHGCKKTGEISVITKTSMGGYVVDEISGQKPVDWYAKRLKMDKKDFLGKVMVLGLTQRWPLGMPDNLGRFVIRGGGVPIGDSLAYVAPLIEGAPVYLMDADPKNLFSATEEIIKNIQEYTEETQAPKLLLITSCLSRRAVLQKDLEKDLQNISTSFGNAPLVGFTCSGEIGSKAGDLATFHHVCNNIFAFYDKLLAQQKKP